ncbi:MAG: CDP-diacylglycerol--glycerol-3-phosphate 3-phosphatidyltransferase [Pseudomonadota bacterium]
MSHPLSLPNLFTYGRLVAVPAVVACFFWGGGFAVNDITARWTALAIFSAAGFTDYMDGWAARRFDQSSSLGRMLDPIADKLLVASCLLLLAADGTIAGWSLWAAIIILCREILVSGLREFLGSVQVAVPVSRLAKWKTTAQLVAIGFLLAGPAGDRLFLNYSTQLVSHTGLVLLWLSAVLTLYTGWDYFRVGISTVVKGNLSSS